MVYSQKTNFLIFLIIIQGLWKLSETKDIVKTIPGVKITCDNDENCEHIMGPGSECVDHNCECKNETCTLKSNLRSKVNAIGEQCGSNTDCNIEDANCIEGYCVCSENQVPSLNNRICLKVSEGLESYCEEDVQCISSINNAVCRDNKCICNNMTHKAQDRCWKNIGLGGLCIQNEDCSHIQLSHCGTMFCECQTEYVASEKKNECLPEVVEPDQVCEQNAQCHFLYGHGGICRYNKCQCDPVHRFVNDKNCPSHLKKYCDDDQDCKMHNEDLSIHCDQNRCECLPPFIEENGRCSDTSSINKMNTVFLSVVSFVLLWKFV